MLNMVLPWLINDYNLSKGRRMPGHSKEQIGSSSALLFKEVLCCVSRIRIATSHYEVDLQSITVTVFGKSIISVTH